MFLRNAWYVAGMEADVTDKLVAVTILNEKIVLYRMTNGQVAALEDACPHRKLPLSMGRIKGDQVECGYHGMVFDCTGTCTRAPATDRPPPGARVRAYPIVASYGLLWIWMGDAALADPSTIFAVDHWGDSAWGMNHGDGMQIQCNYLLMTDNLLDPTHVAWVHQSSFASSACEDTPLQTTLADNGVTVWRWLQDAEPAPFYAPYLKYAGRSDRKQQYEVRYPSHAVIRAILTPAGTGGEGMPLHQDVFLMDSYNFMTPVDENTTKYYWFQMRNFAPNDEEVSRQIALSVRTAFEEDRVILQAVHKGLQGKTSPNIDLKIDVGPMRFRRRLSQLIEAEQAQAKPELVAQIA